MNKGRNGLSIPKLQLLDRWSLGMDKWFHPTFYWACDYVCMLWLKLINAGKIDPKRNPFMQVLLWEDWGLQK